MHAKFVLKSSKLKNIHSENPKNTCQTKKCKSLSKKPAEYSTIILLVNLILFESFNDILQYFTLFLEI